MTRGSVHVTLIISVLLCNGATCIYINPFLYKQALPVFGGRVVIFMIKQLEPCWDCKPKSDSSGK